MNPLRKLTRLAGQISKVVLLNPGRLSHILGVTRIAVEEVADRSCDLKRFPEVAVEDLLPEPGAEARATLALMPKSNSSISVVELVALILLQRKAAAKSIFEFGTYKGASITQMALNMPEGSRIYTLDLPDDDPRSAFAITDAHDRIIAQEKGKGALVPPDLRGRIQFLKQDSATFDDSPFAGTMDFVFVDGAHNTDYVRNDSEKAWRMLRSGGIVAWHDCRVADPEVVRYLIDSPFKPTRVVGTSLAFATKP